MKLEQVIYMLRKLQSEMIAEDRSSESEALCIAEKLINEKITEEKSTASNSRMCMPNTRNHGSSADRMMAGRGVRAGTLSV